MENNNNHTPKKPTQSPSRPTGRPSQPRAPQSRGSQSGNGSQTSPTRRNRQRAPNNLSYILFVLGVSLIISSFALLTANDMFGLIKPEKTVILTVEEPLSAGKMAKLLKKNQVISYPWAFDLYCNLKDSPAFKTGKFEFDTSMDYGQIINTLMRASTYRDTVSVTIPEGYTLLQIAETMEDTMVCSKEDFLKTAATYPYKHTFLQDVPMTEKRLEGYLFPDTYQFYKNDKTVNVINKMLNNFDEKYSTEVRKLAENAKMSTHDILTIASMIEREAVLESERKVISGVIANRLKNSKNFPYLNIDATVQYALDKHKQALTTEDLKVDSPYNTYLYKGLPPGPIANPGMGSILAAISPESHKYYYYVASGAEDGGHIFSKTLDEHNAARARVAAGKTE